MKTKYAYVGVMMFFAFVMTYILLKLMLASHEDFYSSRSLFDQAAFVACVIGVIELVVMNIMNLHPAASAKEKYQDATLIAILTVLSFLLAWRVQHQAGASDKEEFYRDLLPNYSMAVRMIREVRPRAFAADPEFQKELNRLEDFQSGEIESMKTFLHLKHEPAQKALF